MRHAPEEAAHKKAVACLELAAAGDFGAVCDIVATLNGREVFVVTLSWIDTALHAQGITEYGPQNRSVPTFLVENQQGRRRG